MKLGKRLTKQSEFRAAYKLGRSYVNRLVVLYVIKQACASDTRAGFVVGRSIGKAVSRNRARRLMREAYRLNATRIAPGYHLVFVARTAMKGTKLSAVEPAVVDLLMRSGLVPR